MYGKACVGMAWMVYAEQVKNVLQWGTFHIRRLQKSKTQTAWNYMDYVKQVKNLKQVTNFTYFEYHQLKRKPPLIIWIMSNRLKLSTRLTVLHILNISS